MEGIFTKIGVLAGWFISLIGWYITYRIFKSERKDRFRMAAIERRLDAHQNAFAHCSKFIDAMDINDEEELHKIYKEGKEFFTNNSLYLEKKTRKTFIDSLGFINAYCPKFTYLNELLPEDRKNGLETFHKESMRIFELSRVIQEEVQLEPIILKSESKVLWRSDKKEIETS